jgi:hypothetical protein
MTTTADSTLAHDPCASDVYDTLDAPLSPPMTALRPRLELSPSPQPAVPLIVSPSPSPGRRKPSNRKKKVPASRGDAVLIHYLGEGRQPDIAAIAGEGPLATDEDDDEHSAEEEDDEDDDFSDRSRSGYTGSPKMTPERPLTSLKSLAMGAVAALNSQPAGSGDSPKIEEAQGEALKQEAPSPPGVSKQQQQKLEQHHQEMQSQPPPPPPQPPPQQQHQQPQLALQPREGGPKPGLAMPITPYTPHGPQPDFYSPRQPNSATGLRHPGDILSPIPTPNGNGDLPPIMASPKSEINSHAPQSLPSIRAQLGDQLAEQQHYPEKEMGWRHASYPHSPPGGPGAMSRIPVVPGGSPPISPNNSYGHSMPSPAHSMFGHPYGYYQNSNNGAPRTSQEYSSAASNHTETPGTDIMSASTPATSIADRMSIDNVTNPQQGTFVCKVPGCSAPAFQTQYLLNSHANVHSSARPHYCPVKGCPRAEGGKGFKRKNEMIRHGLVHDSPGYVCPFCPDREHKYPRPDNLQRHVRVHHVDKDKDDPMLRDVLSQRPDGPNRGRRRRGAP